MNKSTILLGVLALGAIGAYASTPCGFPKQGQWHPGGQCMSDGWGNYYCSQPHEVSPPKCVGTGNPKNCNVVNQNLTVDRFVPRYSNENCLSGGCVKNGTNVVSAKKFVTNEEDCITFKN